jgi:hypothetical protein
MVTGFNVYDLVYRLRLSGLGYMVRDLGLRV